MSLGVMTYANRLRWACCRFQGVRKGEEQQEGHLSPWKKQRKNDLREALEAEEPLFTEPYPRVGSSNSKEGGIWRKSVPEFVRDFEERLPNEEVNLMGRVRAKRISGKGLIFLDIVNEFQKVQVMLSKKGVKSLSRDNANRFELFRNLIQIGDHICKPSQHFAS
ncbi:lysyl-tRNA synthetase [Geosmithia morbida]|uniref:Lysyl-tRNA synthetase n=1 Tax=Geosmithia morbida TaxID=1094350 RepID=A0A9P5D838_9HYPO|nr:lysyl-tRNA synthetase [Geosmithia morbida]KAF4125134.1 lysyl-tRNA synthetase [Geosmithia morbida]